MFQMALWRIHLEYDSGMKDSAALCRLSELVWTEEKWLDRF